MIVKAVFIVFRKANCADFGRLLKVFELAKLTPLKVKYPFALKFYTCGISNCLQLRKLIDHSMKYFMLQKKKKKTERITFGLQDACI